MDSAKGNPSALVVAPFIGFMLGCILFGCTLLQAYSYFRNYMHDTRLRKILVVVVCFLDALELVFSANMLYFSVLDPLHRTETDFLWTLKGSATSTVLLNFIVQSYYLSIIWRFANNSLVAPMLTRVIRMICLSIFSYALVVFIVWLTYVERIDSFLGMTEKFQWMIYFLYGSSAIIDTGNAVVLSSLLFKTSPQNHQRFKSGGVLRFLVLFFIGTGALTAITALATMLICSKRPSSSLYLAVEVSRTRLLSILILVMFNSKERLRQQMEATVELKIPSELLFGHGPGGSTADGSVTLEGASDAA